MVPIIINTCYPPNWIQPSAAYALGRAVREAIQSWDSDLRVGIVTSGGLSHFCRWTKRYDRTALRASQRQTARSLRLCRGTGCSRRPTEILNWVAAAGAMGDTRMEVCLRSRLSLRRRHRLRLRSRPLDAVTGLRTQD